MKTLIRRASGADFETLLALDAACFSQDIAYDSVELSFLMERPGAETLVLEEDGEIAAFLLMEVNRRRKRATLVTLDVREESRRKGHAARLLEHAENILRERTVALYDLQVDVRNDAAIAFYRKHGFETERVLKNYYPGGHDGWQMIKKLQRDGSG